MFYILFIVIVDSWNVNKISISISEYWKYGRNFMYGIKLSMPVIKSILTKPSICKKTFRSAP